LTIYETRLSVVTFFFFIHQMASLVTLHIEPCHC